MEVAKTPAEKHYEAMQRAQKNYYERKQIRKAQEEGRERRKPGRPRKVVAEGVVQGV